jgi:hypothetical protein
MRSLARCLPAAAVLLSGSLAARAGETGRLDASPVWGGAFRAGSWTEARVLLLSELGGTATLAVAAGDSPAIEAAVRLEAQVPRRVSLPVWPAADTSVHIEAKLPDGRTATAEVAFMPTADSLWVALAAEIPAGELESALPETARLMSALPEELPHHAEAYRPLDAFVLGEAEFAVLDAEQREALAAYLRACGVLVFAGTAEAFEPFRAEAGCGAERVARAADPAGTAAALADLLARPPLSLPGASELRARLPAEHAAEMPVAALLACYGLALLAAARSSRRTWPLLALPAAFAGLALAGFVGKPPATGLAVLAEADAGTGHARYSALLRVDGRGPWRGGQPIPAGAEPERAAPLRLDPDRPAQRQLAVAASLWSRDEWLLRGTADLEPPLSLESGGREIVVANPGSVPSPPGLMAAHRRLFDLPALAPGARWSPPKDSVPMAASPEADLLKPYLLRGETAVLVPYVLPDRRWAGRSDGAEWLVIRGAS